MLNSFLYYNIKKLTILNMIKILEVIFMKKLIILITIIFAGLSRANSQPDLINLEMSNSNLGKNFWVAIPQNDVSNSGLRQEGIEIVCTPIRNTTIFMEVPELGVIKSKSAEAFKVTSFSTNNNDFGWTMEVNESEVVSKKGIHLYADQPFSVYVINSKQYSSDGYAAIPVEGWDKDYYHCAYYDWYQNSGDDRNKYRGAGFIVIASENGTNVTIKLDGVGKGFAKTVGGLDIGETINVQLNEGQTYMVRGDGKTKGQFDLTGTLISASKPIGVVSFHLRTMIPYQCTEDRDHINEMIPPISSLGKRYATVAFNRTPRGGAKGEGDLFRVVATQKQTDVKCDFYDKSTLKLIGHRDVLIQNAGGWNEVDPIGDVGNNNTKKSVRGISYWQSDKPFLLVQNAFSQPWDGDSKWSPLSVVVPPIEQYVPGFVFQTPDKTDFNDNEITLFAIGDPNDPDNKLLKSIKHNGTEIWKKYPQLFGNRIEATDIYWIRFKVDLGTHNITSDTKIGGFLNGFSSFNAYGYPVGMGTNKIDEYDVEPPVLTRSGKCGNFTYEATETKVGKVTDNPRQLDQGLKRIAFFSEKSYNVNFSMENPNNFKPQMKISRQKFFLNVVDLTKPAYAIVGIMDRAGNFILDTLTYLPEVVEYKETLGELGILHFGEVRAQRKKELPVKITNNSGKPINFTSVSIKTSFFELKDNPFPFTLENGESKELVVVYSPKNRTAPNAPNTDTLIFNSECLTYKIPLIGIGVLPAISADQHDFGEVLLNSRLCIEEQNNKGFKIENTGNYELIVNAIENIKPPFMMTTPTEPTFPFSVMPGEKVYLKSICFIPNDSIVFEQNITIKSDAENGDLTVKLIGKGKAKQQDPNLVTDNEISDFGIISASQFEDKLKIDFNLTSASDLTLNVYDLKGLVLSTLRKNMVLSGRNYIELDVNFLPSGLYFIEMRSGTNISVKKFIFLR